MVILGLFLAIVAIIPIASGLHSATMLNEPPPVMRTVATLENFMMYRNAVQTFGEQNPAFTGNVSDSSLTNLPGGYQKLGPWTNEISVTQIVVYGSANIGMIGASAQSNQSSILAANYLVGYAKGGNWVTTSAGILSAAPGYVPEGAILAIINKQ